MKNKKPKLQKVTKKINRTSSSQKKRNGKNMGMNYSGSLFL